MIRHRLYTERDSNRLTPRESQSWELMARGYRNKDIANVLGISVCTVKLYNTSLYTKLGVYNRVEATARYLQLNDPAATSTFTDCRSEIGVTVGIVDALITMVRLLAQRDLSAPEVQEALKDLRSDEDLRTVLGE